MINTSKVNSSQRSARAAIFSLGSLHLSRNEGGHWETFVVTPPNTERSLHLDHRLKSVKAGAEGPDSPCRGPDGGDWTITTVFFWGGFQCLNGYNGCLICTTGQPMMIWLINMANYRQTMGIQDGSTWFVKDGDWSVNNGGYEFGAHKTPRI